MPETTPRPTLINCNSDDHLKINSDPLDVSYNTMNNNTLSSNLLESSENKEKQLENRIKFQRYILYAIISQLLVIFTVCYVLKNNNNSINFINSNKLEIICLLCVYIFGFILFINGISYEILRKYKIIVFILNIIYISFICYLITIKYNTNIIISSTIILIIILFCNIIATEHILIYCTNICFILCVVSFLFMFTGFVHIFKLGFTDKELLYIDIIVFLYVWYVTYNIKLLSMNKYLTYKDYIISSILIYYNFITIAFKKIATCYEN